LFQTAKLHVIEIIELEIDNELNFIKVLNVENVMLILRVCYQADAEQFGLFLLIDGGSRRILVVIVVVYWQRCSWRTTRLYTTRHKYCVNF